MAISIVEVFLPAAFPDGTPIPKAQFDLVHEELMEQFGGLTSYDRKPARGLWKESDHVDVDPILIVEVMTGSVDKRWWKAFRNRMEEAFRQKEILIRVHSASRL